MREVKEIVRDVTEIFQKTGQEAKDYLDKARKLKRVFGSGPAVVYCWFFSVPQKWIQVEPTIFKVMGLTKFFDLDTIIMTPIDQLATILRPIVFHNKMALYLKNFCRAIKNEYGSWKYFDEALERENIMDIIGKLRKYNAAVTFKNLAAMKIIVGMNNNLIILDTHVSRVLGIRKKQICKFKTQNKSYAVLLRLSNIISNRLRANKYNATIAEWSLSLWFYGSGIHSSELLQMVNSHRT